MLPSAGPNHGRDDRVERSVLSRGVAGLVLGLVAMTFAPPALAADPVDLGDAPVRYDEGRAGPARAELGGPRLGTAVTADAVRRRNGLLGPCVRQRPTGTGATTV